MVNGAPGAHGLNAQSPVGLVLQLRVPEPALPQNLHLEVTIVLESLWMCRMLPLSLAQLTAVGQHGQPGQHAALHAEMEVQTRGHVNAPTHVPNMAARLAEETLRKPDSVHHPHALFTATGDLGPNTPNAALLVELAEFQLAPGFATILHPLSVAPTAQGHPVRLSTVQHHHAR